MSDIWLSQEEVSALENIKKRAFWKRFKQNHYKSFRYVKSENGGRGGQRLEITLSSLSTEAQNLYLQKKYNHTELTPQELAADFKINIPPEKLINPKIQSKVRMIVRCLSIPDEVNDRSAQIREIAESCGYAQATAYRLLDRVKKGELLIKPTKNYGIHKADLGITLRAWDERAAEMSIELIMGNKRRHQDGLTLYTIIKDTAEAENLTIGTYASFMRLKKKIGGAIKTYRDKGRQGLRQDIIPGIRRDPTSYRPMEVLIGDQHKADYYAIDSNGKVATLELFCWMDFRSQMVWGAVSYKHYNRYTVGQALINAVGWGLPSVCYTDWGKPEESNYMTLLIEQLTGLGVTTESIDHIKAEGRHPQAKPIEGFFGNFDRRLKNAKIPGYCKRLKDSRENELQQKQLNQWIKTNQLWNIPDLAAKLIGELSRWNKHHFKNRNNDNGRSPLEIYTDEVKQHPVATLSDDTLDYIFLPKRDLLIRRCQVSFQHEWLGKKVYYDRALADYQGYMAEVRYNPFDPWRVWVFVERKLICEAEEWGMINPKIPAQVEAKRAEQKALADQIRATYKKYAPPTKPVRKINRHEREAREVSKVIELRIRKTSLEKQMEEQGETKISIQAGGDPLEEFRKQFHPDATKARMHAYEEKEYKPLFKLSMKQLHKED